MNKKGHMDSQISISVPSHDYADVNGTCYCNRLHHSQPNSPFFCFVSVPHNVVLDSSTNFNEWLDNLNCRSYE